MIIKSGTKIPCTTWQDGVFWVSECKAIGAVTQGVSKADAMNMIGHWIKDMADDQELGVELHEESLLKDGKWSFAIVASKDIDTKKLSRN